MIEERTLIIPGIMERVPEVCEFVAQAATVAGLDDRGVYHCEMATDEWCTNIIEHGYAESNQNNPVEVVLRVDRGRLTIVIADEGPPFDPTQLPEPDPTMPLEAREPGGLGWFFIQKIMDEVRYEFLGNRNQLTMVKYSTPGDSEHPDQKVTAPFPMETLPSGVRVVKPTGRIDASQIMVFEAALVAQIDANYRRIVVEMNGVSYISSVGLKTLLTMRRLLAERGGLIALAGMTDRVREVFVMSGFDTLFTITPTVEEAAQTLVDLPG